MNIGGSAGIQHVYTMYHHRFSAVGLAGTPFIASSSGVTERASDDQRL